MQPRAGTKARHPGPEKWAIGGRVGRTGFGGQENGFGGQENGLGGQESGLKKEEGVRKKGSGVKKKGLPEIFKTKAYGASVIGRDDSCKMLQVLE